MLDQLSADDRQWPTQQLEQLVIKPSWRSWSNVLAAVAGTLVVRLGIQLYNGVGLDEAVWYVGIAAVPVGAYAVYVWRTRIVVTSTEICYERVYRRRVWSRSDVGEVITAAVSETNGLLWKQTSRRLVLLDHTGRSIMHIAEGTWTLSDMRRIVKQLGITPTDPGRVITTEEFATHRPKAFSWWARPTVVGRLARGVAVLALVAAGVAVAILD